jgi:hypothetical protein
MKNDRENYNFQKEFNLFTSRNIINDHESLVYRIIISSFFKIKKSSYLNLFYDQKNRNVNLICSMRFIPIALKGNALRETKMNWKGVDKFKREYKNSSVFCNQINHLMLLLSFLDKNLPIDVFETAQLFVNLTSSYLLPQMVTEKEKPVLCQIEHKEEIPDQSYREYVQIKEVSIINNEISVEYLGLGILSEDNITGTIKNLKLISGDSTIMSKMASEYSTNK